MNPQQEGGEAPASSPSSSFALRALNALINGLVRLGGVVSTLLILVVLVVVTYAVFQRYVLGTPLQWGEELNGYLLVAIVMFGAAEALRRNEHITIDLLAARAGPRGKWLLAIWGDLAVLAFAGMFTWSIWQTIAFAMDFGEYSSGYIEIPTWIPQIPMLLGTVLLMLVAARRILQRLGQGPEGAAAQETGE